MEYRDELDRSAAPKGGAITHAHQASIGIGPLTIEPALRLVRHDQGAEEFLQPRIMQVLVALIRADGKILTRDALTASCWDGVVVGEDSINRVIGQLRRLSEGIGRGCFQVETITKVGYRLIFAPPATRVWPDVRRSDTPRAAVPKLSICVLPFANRSGDPEQEYFSDGISEDIITDLAKVSALSVVACSTAFTFKGRSIDLPEVARQLGVSHVLEGSVRKAGGRVRITAQLIDGVAGDHIWSERWDRDLTDIFALQDEIAQAVVRALKLKLLPEEKARIERRGTESVDAYNLYLMARQHLVSGNKHDKRVAETIVRLCRTATEIDPHFARAWALMAHAQTSLHFVEGKPDDGLEAAERALSLDPDLAEARAIRARHLHRVGRKGEALCEIESALRLDADSHEVNGSAAALSFRERRFDDAIHYWERATMLAETDFGSPDMLISCYAAVGNIEASHRAARTTLARAEKALGQDQNNGFAMSAGVSALATLGEADRARDWIDRALRAVPEAMTVRYNLACSLAERLRDADGALDLLEGYFATAVQGDLAWIKIDRDLDSLRDDPRFQAMLAAAEARLVAAKPADGAGALGSA